MNHQMNRLTYRCLPIWPAVCALAVLAAGCGTGGGPTGSSEKDLVARAVVRREANPIHNFCLAPPGPVSDKIRVELRLAVWNDSSENQYFDVAFFLDEISENGAIHSETVAVPPGGSHLVSHWWPSAGTLGVHTFLYEVRRDGELRESGSWELEILPSKTSALPWAQGMWFDPGGLLGEVYRQNRPATPQDVRDAIDAMRDIGVTMVGISYVEAVAFGSGWGPFYPSLVEELGPRKIDLDVVGTILDQAARNGQRVVLGIGRGPDANLVFGGYKDPERNEKALDIARRVCQELWGLYSQYPSFYGWYLCHEANDLDGMGKVFFNPLSDFMHEFAPAKLVLLGPSGTRKWDPLTFMAASYDVVFYQDGVGPGFVPYKYTWDPELRIAQLEDVCAGYRAAHINTNKHCWANVETWEMAGPDYTDGFAADFSRVKRQIDIEKKYFEMITMYEFIGTMDWPGAQIALGRRGERSKRLYEEYKAYYETEIRKARDQVDRARKEE